jgi:hypothetical protein
MIRECTQPTNVCLVKIDHFHKLAHGRGNRLRVRAADDAKMRLCTMAVPGSPNDLALAYPMDSDRLRDLDFHFSGNCPKPHMTGPAISWREIAVTQIDHDVGA